MPEDGYTFNMLVVDVMVPFYPCFNFNFLLFLGMVTMIMSLKQKKMEIPRGTGAPAGGYSLCRWPIREVPPETRHRRYVTEVPF